MGTNVLNFWLGFLDGVGDLCMTEPYIYFFGLFVGFVVLGYLAKFMRINR